MSSISHKKASFIYAFYTQIFSAAACGTFSS